MASPLGHQSIAGSVTDHADGWPDDEEQRKAMMEEVARDLHKAIATNLNAEWRNQHTPEFMRGTGPLNTEPMVPIVRSRVYPKVQVPVEGDEQQLVTTTVRWVHPYFSVTARPPIEEAVSSTDGPALDQARTTVSIAIKALAALCRRGDDIVTIDGEQIDLWDVKRDLRALLGPDGD